MSYRHECFVFSDGKPQKAVVRTYTKRDADGLIAVQKEAFPPPFPQELLWTKEQLSSHVDHFPDGAVCVEVDGEIVGSITALIVQYEPGDVHTWSEITDDGWIRTHRLDGNTLYVVDICVKPAFRKLGLAKKLLDALYHVVIQYKLERLLGGSRLPYYHRYQSEWTPEEYVKRVAKGDVNDPVMTFLMKAGRTPAGVMHDYLEDEESGNCAALMEWKNPFQNG